MSQRGALTKHRQAVCKSPFADRSQSPYHPGLGQGVRDASKSPPGPAFRSERVFRSRLSLTATTSRRSPLVQRWSPFSDCHRPKLSSPQIVSSKPALAH